MRIFTLAICWLLVVSVAIAQDPQFSQFYANRTYLNPAFTGTEEGLTLTAHSRWQWYYVPGAFRTYSFSAEIQEPVLSSGFGLQGWKDVEGEGALTTTNASFQYSYQVPIIKSALTSNAVEAGKSLYLAFGGRVSYARKTIDWGKLIFSDQLDPVYGVVYPTNAVPQQEGRSYVDFDAGAVALFNYKVKRRTGSGNLGFSINHLPNLINPTTGADESLMRVGTLLPYRITLHGGTSIPISSLNTDKGRAVYISPNFKADFQDKIEVWTVGAFAISDPIYLGFFYANQNPFANLLNTNAMIFVVGFSAPMGPTNTVTAGYSYDLNTSGLGTKVQGAHELSIRINFGKISLFGTSDGEAGLLSGGRNSKGKYRGNCYSFKGRNAMRVF